MIELLNLEFLLTLDFWHLLRNQTLFNMTKTVDANRNEWVKDSESWMKTSSKTINENRKLFKSFIQEQIRKKTSDIENLIIKTSDRKFYSKRNFKPVRFSKRSYMLTSTLSEGFRDSLITSSNVLEIILYSTSSKMS